MARLRPVCADVGQVLMHPEPGGVLLLIESGRAGVRHVGDDGAVVLGELSAGAIVGRSRC